MEEKQLNNSGNRRGMSPNSRKNLETGRNKKGRPKDEDAISNILREMGSTIPLYPKRNGEMETRTRREIACERLWDIAVHGEPKQVISAMYFITERTEGKITQPIEGQFITEVRWIIGKGYGNGNSGIPADKQVAERLCRN